MSSKARKGKNKYDIIDMLEWWIKKLQRLKNPFYRKFDQKLNWGWSKG